MADNIAMAREGTQFTADGISLSWPWNGIRQVIHIPPADRPLSFRRRVAEGHIVETDLPATETYEPGKITDYRLLTGEEARRHKAIPAGPVIPVAEYLRYGDEAVNFYAQQEELSGVQRETAFAEVEAKRAAEEVAARATTVPPDPEPEALPVVETEPDSDPVADVTPVADVIVPAAPAPAKSAPVKTAPKTRRTSTRRTTS